MVSNDLRDASSTTQGEAPRRDFMKFVSAVSMSGGLLASYGTFAAMAGRYLYTSDAAPVWQFVTHIDEMPVGEARNFVTPSGAKIVIARQSEGPSENSFVALSSICPHLGCQVHWEASNSRFFCPCHNGAFDSSGTATSGPPAQARQALVRFLLRVENRLLYVLIPSKSLSI